MILQPFGVDAGCQLGAWTFSFQQLFGTGCTCGRGLQGEGKRREAAVDWVQPVLGHPFLSIWAWCSQWGRDILKIGLKE